MTTDPQRRDPIRQAREALKKMMVEICAERKVSPSDGLDGFNYIQTLSDAALTPPPVESEVAPELKETLEMVKRHLDRKISPLEYSRTTIKLLYDAAQASTGVAGRMEAAEKGFQAAVAMREAIRGTGYPNDHPIWAAIKLYEEALTAYNIAKGGKS